MKPAIKLRVMVIALIMVIVLSIIASLPVWEQNRYHELMSENRNLSKVVTSLNMQIVQLNLQIQQLQALRRLESIGRDHFGMEFQNFPYVVEVK